MLNFSFLGTEILCVCLCFMAEVLQLDVKKKKKIFFFRIFDRKEVKWMGTN